MLLSMLLWILGLLLVLAASALLGSFVTVEMIPEAVEAFANGEAGSVLLLSLVIMALVAIIVVGVTAGPVTQHAELRRRLRDSPLAIALNRRRLRRNAATAPEPVVGVKLANVHWHDTRAEPEFSGASAGNPYQRDDLAYCGHQPTDRLCVDQHADHRCGFYALPTGTALLAELTGLSEAQAVDAYDWCDVLEPFHETTHVVTVALHGEVMTYDAAVRGQRQTVIAIDLPATCSRQHCDGPVDAVAAVGYPLGLCALHAASPELAERTLPIDEFAWRFDIALHPTTPTGHPAPRPDHQRRNEWVATAALAEAPSADMPVEHRDDRVEGWLTGSFDIERGQLITDGHRLSADTHANEPVVATREALAPPSGQALARVRLGGEVVVRRASVSSRDVQVWDLYLPARCQHAACHQAGDLVDRDGALAVTRCRSHASRSARPPAQYGADHGVAIQLGC